MMLSALLPRYEIDACFEDIREGCVLFSNYLDGTILDVEIEFESWQLACGALKEKPCDSLSSLDVCNAPCFPNIRKLLTIFATLPVSTATAERSFFSFKVAEEQLALPDGRGTTDFINASIHLKRHI
jgi:hAT family C-terminal dimerisation region